MVSRRAADLGGAAPRMAERPSPTAPAPLDEGKPPRSSSRGGEGRAEGAHAAGDLVAGKYRLERLMGEGGMGSVWRAHNEALDMAVAIKVIRHREGAAEAERRLLQEARAAAKLEHPAIVRVFDFGESELGEPFIVMELLYGESLGEHLARSGRLSAAEAVRLLLPVASGLAAAHAKGVVHRDLKPDNVVLVRRDDGAIAPKIVDFGIAKLPNDDQRDTLTALGTVLGSPDYMSPEQAKGQSDVDARSDVWSLAVVLYELVTGQRPFGGPNYNALLSAIMINDPAPITDFAAGDAQLWALMRRAFEKDTARRWPSMREFGQALGAWAAEHGVTTDVTGASIAAHWGSFDPTPEPPYSLDLAHSPSAPAALRGPPTIVGAPPEDDPAPRRRGRRALWLPLSAALATGAFFALRAAPARAPLPAATTSYLATPLPSAAENPPLGAAAAPPSATPQPLPGRPAPPPGPTTASLAAAARPPDALPSAPLAPTSSTGPMPAPLGRAALPRRATAPGAASRGAAPAFSLAPPEAEPANQTPPGDGLPIPADPNF